MTANIKLIKTIAYLFATLLLFQSCIAYKSKSSSIDEASQFDKRIEIKTTDGERHNFKWIEERSENVISIKNTSIEMIEKEKITQVVKLNPEPTVISLDSALNYWGTLRILMSEKGKTKSQEFIRLTEKNNLIRGIKMTEKDTSTIIIPKNQIASIKLQDKTATTVGNVLIVGGVVTGILFIAASQASYGNLLYP
jgi:hypothetical protein